MTAAAFAELLTIDPLDHLPKDVANICRGTAAFVRSLAAPPPEVAAAGRMCVDLIGGLQAQRENGPVGTLGRVMADSLRDITSSTQAAIWPTNLGV